MICEMQSTNQMWSSGISRTSSAFRIEREGIVLVTYSASSFFLGANTSRMARIVSKYCSAPMRSATALPSGRSMSRSASFAANSRTCRRHAATLQERDQERAGGREVDHVLRTGVHRPAHLHDLKGPEQVASALQVPHHDDPVGDRFFHAEGRVSLPRGRDLRDEERRAPHSRQGGPELQDELADELFGLEALPTGGDGIYDKPI